MPITIKSPPLVGADADEKYTITIDDEGKATYWIDQTDVGPEVYTAAVLTELLAKITRQPASVSEPATRG